MAKRYSNEDKQEALKLAEEIGVTAAAQRLGINKDTIHGWRNRRKKQAEILKQKVAGRSEEELMAEITGLRAALQQAEKDVEVLREALGFFVRSRRK